MRLPKSISTGKSRLMMMALCLGIAPFLSGCVVGGFNSCTTTVSEAGVYRVTFQDLDGALVTIIVTADGPGHFPREIEIDCCSSLVDDPVLLKPDIDLSVSITDSPDPVAV